MIKYAFSVGYRMPFAYVAFGGGVTHWWTHFLKKGFYHCFVILGNGREWCIIDPVMHFTDLIILKTRDVVKILSDKKYFLVRTTPQIPTDKKLRFRPVTCVEMTCRFLGITDRKIWTPYQLFRFLIQKKENNP